MRLQINKKDIIDALKNVEIRGRWATTSGLSSKSLGNYIHFELQDNELLLINSDDSTTAIKSIPVESEEQGSFVLEINTLKKYLEKMNDEITFEIGDTVVMLSEGKRATMPIVIQHPFDGRINRMLGRWPLPFNENLEEVITMGEIEPSCGVQVTGEELDSAIDACEIVNNGIYRLDFIEADEITRPKLIISSEVQVSSYREEMPFSRVIGESSTVLFSGPLHKFFNKKDIINIFIGDDQPIIMVTANSVLVRAPRMGV
mgnify:CR=1 FL=1